MNKNNMLNNSLQLVIYCDNGQYITWLPIIEGCLSKAGAGGKPLYYYSIKASAPGIEILHRFIINNKPMIACTRRDCNRYMAHMLKEKYPRRVFRAICKGFKAWENEQHAAKKL